MALRDQPYLPLYVQDFLTDEKLMECSASATGVYIRVLCIMHKSDEYGTILLKQKDKQTDNQIKNFALKLAKYLPYNADEIMSGILELLNEGVLQSGGDKLIQKRMVKDNEISIIRAKSGKKGGDKNPFAKAKIKAKVKAKSQAKSEIEDINENRSLIDIEWCKWKEFKKAEFNFKYKSEISEQASKTELINLSGNDEEIAIKIIQQSMANGWKGFFKLKNNGTERTNNKGGATPEQLRELISRTESIDK